MPSDKADALKPLLCAVGDGIHSVATAKAHWEKQKAAGVGDDHPARFALVQLQHLHVPALESEPIHRLLLNVKAEEFRAGAKWVSGQGEGAPQKHQGKKVAEVPGHCVEYWSSLTSGWRRTARRRSITSTAWRSSTGTSQTMGLILPVIPDAW